MSAEAESGHEVGPIRMGMVIPGVAGGGDRASARLYAFCDALAATVSVAVLPRGFAHYRDLVDPLREGAIDLAWLPPIVALRAAAGGARPIALPVRGGASTYSAALFTRPGSSLHAIEDLTGVRAAWVDRDSSAGYLVIRAALRARGVDLERAFASEVFLGTHGAVVEAVLDGAADVGATFAQIDPRTDLVESAGWGRAEVRVIAHGGPIPADVLAAGGHLPTWLVRAIQGALLDPSNKALARAAADLFAAEGLVEALPEHLGPLNHLLRYLEDARRPSTLPPPPPAR